MGAERRRTALSRLLAFPVLQFTAGSDRNPVVHALTGDLRPFRLLRHHGDSPRGRHAVLAAAGGAPATELADRSAHTADMPQIELPGHQIVVLTAPIRESGAVAENIADSLA